MKVNGLTSNRFQSYILRFYKYMNSGTEGGLRPAHRPTVMSGWQRIRVCRGFTASYKWRGGSGVWVHSSVEHVGCGILIDIFALELGIQHYILML
jgi:hypothetical protein